MLVFNLLASEIDGLLKVATASAAGLYIHICMYEFLFRGRTGSTTSQWPHSTFKRIPHGASPTAVSDPKVSLEMKNSARNKLVDFASKLGNFKVF